MWELTCRKMIAPRRLPPIAQIGARTHVSYCVIQQQMCPSYVNLVLAASLQYHGSIIAVSLQHHCSIIAWLSAETSNLGNCQIC